MPATALHLSAVFCRLAAFALPLSLLAGTDSLESRVTFHCISLYWTRPEAGACTMEYRATRESAWQRGQDLWCDSDVRTVRPATRPASLPANDRWFDPAGGRRVTNQYRGSLVNLEPGTDYEIRLTVSGETRTVHVATRGEGFRIKKRIQIGSQPTFATTEGGSASEGFVLYDGGGSAVIDAGNRHPHCIRIQHSYVIIRGFKAVNAANDAIVIGDVRATKTLARNALKEVVAIASDLTDVVIEHCEITQWGSLRTSAPGAQWSNMESGILAGSVVQRLVIQRNRIHRPRYTATRWNEQPGVAHAWGARGISLGHVSDREPWEANHVIRYNEIIGDADHLLEDGICGGLNFSYTGTPGQDSDIYGNIITHATDDLIEADGGGMNVRIWGNYLEGGLRFISLQSLPLGPVYIFRNVLGPPGRHLTSYASQNPLTYVGRSPFKFVANDRGRDRWKLAGHTPFNGPVYIYHNSLVAGGFSTAFEVSSGGHLRNIVSRNNILLTSQYHLHDGFSEQSRDEGPPPHNLDFAVCSFDFDLHNQDSAGDSVARSLGRHNLKAEPQWRPGHGVITGSIGRFQLAAGTPGHNAGVALPNFNRGDDEEGGAPDIGAHEFGAPNLSFGVAAHWTAP